MVKVQRRKIQNTKWSTLLTLSGFPEFSEVKPMGFTYAHYKLLEQGQAIAELANSNIWVYRIKHVAT